MFDPLSFRLQTVDLSLIEFLIYCLDPNDDRLPLGIAFEELAPLRRAFLEAGINALAANAGISNWVHFGIEPKDGCASGELYARLSGIARRMLQVTSISNFFFMHKPPGLRIRFEIASTSKRPYYLRYLREQLAVWKNEGLIEKIEEGIYEPEAHLFGGPVSMHSVHQLFTHDSLAWLDFHALVASKGEVTGPEWILSLAMLRAVFTGLGITDWEDVDIWDTIRRKMGRSLHSEVLKDAEFAASAAEIRSLWLRPHLLIDQLSPEVRAIAERYQQIVNPIIAKWRREYFSDCDAYIGPRAAAALFTIFHWNRGALQSILQALLVESLVRQGPN